MQGKYPLYNGFRSVETDKFEFVTVCALFKGLIPIWWSWSAAMTWFQGGKHRGIAEVCVGVKPSHSIPTMTDDEVLIPIVS